MGKKRPAWDYQHYLRYLKEGRGQGSGSSYKPWIYIHDFPSRGVSARIMGRTTGRIHHLLSRNEEHYFYLLDADPSVLDIREQCIDKGVSFKFRQTGTRLYKDGRLYSIARKFQHSQARKAGINYGGDTFE